MPDQFDRDEEEKNLRGIREREEEDVVQILSQKYGLPYADLTGMAIDTDALRLIPEADARAADAVAFQKNGKKLSVAVAAPNNPKLGLALDSLRGRGYALQEFLVSKRSLEKAFSRYAELSYATESKAGVFDISGEQIGKLATELGNIPALRSFLANVLEEKRAGEVTRFLEGMLAGAVAMKASDIHIEPEEAQTRLRLRVDGILTDVITFDSHVYARLASRLELLAGMKLNIASRAQDGRFSVLLEGRQIEIRASLIPDNYGPSFVLRILDPKAVETNADNLPIHPKLKARLFEEIQRPNGMLLTTGPTGSGKTTTLYAFLRKIYTPDIKIITIEDPIEYHLEGIVQTQVSGEKYTFASGLRSIVRQDPDVIMVGEIRDGETANIAIEAALTGHFVYSTLHTNDAAGTFPRLVDLGADPKSFGSAVTIAMAQRLFRKLNPSTRRERPLTDDEKRLVDRVLGSVVDTSLLPAKVETTWEAVPGEAGDTGYQGRTGVYEAIFMDGELGDFLRDNPSESDIAKLAAKQGYLTMAQDGIVKALAGITSLSEVASTVDLPQ
ncbi:MAG: type II/IV secretion system protein [Patescibacteria group bacterium]|nr:type II/IV secretion system protein [Patescibacteria group bacterium]